MVLYINGKKARTAFRIVNVRPLEVHGERMSRHLYELKLKSMQQTIINKNVNGIVRDSIVVLKLQLEMCSRSLRSVARATVLVAAVCSKFP